MDDLANANSESRRFGVHIRSRVIPTRFSSMKPPEEGAVVQRGWAWAVSNIAGTIRRASCCICKPHRSAA